MDNSIIFSYFPSLEQINPATFGFEDTSDAGVENLKKQISELYDNRPCSSARGCIWSLDDHRKAHPILIYDNAKGIRENLIWWSGEKPHDWFKMAFFNRDGYYGLVLMPDLKRSFARCNAYRVSAGLDLISDKNCHVLFDPLNFISKSDVLFRRVKSQIGERVKVGFINSSDIDFDNCENIDFELVEYVNDIEVGTDDICDYYLAELFDSADG